MPEGILIIDWDEFEGGYVSFKHPDIQIPDNLVQLLQISHSFNPGTITIQEDAFHAISIGSESLQKVIVLILSPFEDANDFTEIMAAITRVVNQNINDIEIMHQELKKIYSLSHSVFKAREAVLKKLTTEVTYHKNRELDLKRSLQWLRLQDDRLEFQVILFLLEHRGASYEEIMKELNTNISTLDEILQRLEKNKIIEKKDQNYHSLIHYLL